MEDGLNYLSHAGGSPEETQPRVGPVREHKTRVLYPVD